MTIEDARFRADVMPEIMKMASEMKIEDLPSEDLRVLAEEAGVTAAVKISMRYGGTRFYVSRELPRKLAYMYVKKHYNGRNTKELVRAVGLSERTVQRWVQSSKTAEQLALDLD